MAAAAESVSATFLPIPLGALSPGLTRSVEVFRKVYAGLYVERGLAYAELCRVGNAIDFDLENTRGLALGPESGPVLSAYPETVLAVFRNLYVSYGIFLQRSAQTMGEKITGSHLEDELLLHSPVALVFESGGQNHHRIFGIHKKSEN